MNTHVHVYMYVVSCICIYIVQCMYMYMYIIHVYTCTYAAHLGRDSVRSDGYVLLPSDLRDMERLGAQLFDAGIDPR